MVARPTLMWRLAAARVGGLDLNQGTSKQRPHCLLVPEAFVQSEVQMRFVLLGLVGALMVLGTPAHAQNYPWCAQYSGRALGGGAELRLRQLRAVHGNRFRHRRFLRAKHD